MHGLFSSSDCWILNGPENSLPYVLSNAGYDVWMGNARGNTYSRKHVKWDPFYSSFWDFSWNEIAIYDLPAMFEHIQNTTGQPDFHYVGHSQGTTVFLALMSTLPQYNKMMRSVHLLSPVAFMEHMTSPITLLAPLVAEPGILSNLISSKELLPSSELLSMLAGAFCNSNVNSSSAQTGTDFCSSFLFLVGGASKHLNYVSSYTFFKTTKNYICDIFTDCSSLDNCHSPIWFFNDPSDSLPPRI